MKIITLKENSQFSNKNNKDEYFLICDNKDKLYLDLVQKGINGFNSSFYRYEQSRFLSYLEKYADNFNRNFNKTEEWSKNSPWWKIKNLYEKFLNVGKYQIILSEEEKQFLNDIIPKDDLYIKVWLNSTEEFKNKTLPSVGKNKEFIEITSLKFNNVNGYNMFSNQYLSINMIKDEDINEVIEVKNIEELYKYQKPVLKFHLINQGNNKHNIWKEEEYGLRLEIDGVFFKKYEENYSLKEIILDLKSIYIEFPNLRFSKFDEYTEKNFDKNKFIKYSENLTYLLFKDKNKIRCSEETINFGY